MRHHLIENCLLKNGFKFSILIGEHYVQITYTHRRDDVVYTPKILAETIVNHFSNQIKGKILEPCAGGGAFIKALKKMDSLHDKGLKIEECEISKGKDFFDYNKKVDWIITTPPHGHKLETLQKKPILLQMILFFS